jgi:hypothetical protein
LATKSIGGGFTEVIEALCNTDEEVVGGGYSASGPGIESLKNYPDSANRKFVVEVKNNNGQGSPNNRTVEAFAICMKISNPA